MTLVHPSLCLFAAVLAFGGSDEDPRAKLKGQPLDEVGAVLEDIEVMRRVLVEQVGQLRTSDSMNTENLRAYRDLFAQRADTVTRYLDAMGRTVYTSDLDSRADYLPGYGAVLSLTVPVATQIEKSKVAEAVQEDGRKSKESLWERKQKEVRGTGDDHGLGRFLAGDLAESSSEEEHLVRFRDDALAELEKTVFAALRDYGHRVRMEPAQRIAVSIKLMQWTVPEFLGDYAADTAKGDLVDSARSWKKLVAARNRTFQGSTRLVFEVHRSALQKFESGDLSAEELLEKMSIRYF